MKHDARNVSGLQVEHAIDDKTGDIKLTYFLNGNRVPKIGLIGKAAERYAGLTLILKDLHSSLRWIKKSAELSSVPTSEQNKTHYVLKDQVAADAKAFFVAAVVFYGKAFVESKGRRAQLSRNSLDEEFRPTHDDAMKFRHNMAAHSGEERLETADSHILLFRTKSGGYECRLATGGKQPAFADFGDESKGFVSLIGHATKKANEQLEKLAPQLIVAARALGTKALQSLARENKPLNLDNAIKRRTEDRNRRRS